MSIDRDPEDALVGTHTDTECRDCPLWQKECDGIAGDGGCFVPNTIIARAISSNWRDCTTLELIEQYSKQYANVVATTWAQSLKDGDDFAVSDFHNEAVARKLKEYHFCTCTPDSDKTCAWCVEGMCDAAAEARLAW